MPDAPLSEIVDLQVAVATLGIPRDGYGIPLILSCNAAFSDRVRAYEDISAVAADFAIDSPEYRAANAMLAQDPHPTTIYIGRAVGKPTLAYQINIATVAVGDNYTIDVQGQGVTPTTVAYTPLADIVGTFLPRTTNVLTQVAHGFTTGDGPYRWSNSGGALPTGLAVDTNYWIIVVTPDTFELAATKANALAGTPVVALSGDGSGTQTLRRCQNDVICAQLVQGLQAVVGKNYTAAQVTGAAETDYVTVTANTPGAWFSLGVQADILRLAPTHISPTPALATDLDAINRANPGFYGVYTLYNSDSVVKDVASWVETNKKIYIADIANTDFATLTVGNGDTADALKTLSRARTATNFRDDPADMGGAAWLGARLATDPGSETWAYANLSGVAPTDTTDTHRTNIFAKHGNCYIVTGGFAGMREGTMCDGGFIDTRRGIDFLIDDVSKSLYEVLIKAKYKIPYTNKGIRVLVNAMKGSLERCESMGIIAPGWTVQFPKVDDVSNIDKSIRLLQGLKFLAVLQGAVQKLRVRGLITL